ncbi:MAG: hypothetical protein KJZ91_00665 [Myxococcales bacterium]|nr:hypothetical protein [Myxococcales bacterium]
MRRGGTPPGAGRRTGAVAVAVALVALGGACALDAPAAVPLPQGDAQVFAARAQPALDARCAEPSCHGDARRPFAIYSPGRRRADPARLHLIEPLDDDELEANALAVAALALEPLAAGAPLAGCLVLCKPLAVPAGGCGHVVGPVFAAPDERHYQDLRAYLDTLAWEEGP